MFYVSFLGGLYMLKKLAVWFQNVLPTVYDTASLSLYEAMGKVMYKLNEVIDLVNQLEISQPNIENIVIDILNKWLNDGTLAQIITEDVLSQKADGHVRSVTSFGADPTGVNDSTTAFNDAITYATNNNTKLVIYPGSYTLSSYIFADYNLFAEDNATYSGPMLIYSKPLQNYLSCQNFFSTQYEYETNANPIAPIPYCTQGIYFNRANNKLYSAYPSTLTITAYDTTTDTFNLGSTIINANIGHASSVTSDGTYLYISESPVHGVIKFNISDLSYQGSITLSAVGANDHVQAFSYNENAKIFAALVWSNTSNSYRIELYNKNLTFIKSFNISLPFNAVVQSAAWIDNNYLALSADSNWDHDNDFGGMFLFVIDIIKDKIVDTLNFGNLRQYNEVQGFTKWDESNYIIYSYSQQNNIKSLFKFNFNHTSPTSTPILNTVQNGSISSVYPRKKIVVNSKNYAFPIAGTSFENANNSGDYIPVATDVINVNPYIKGSLSYPFKSLQAATASIPSKGEYDIYYCGDMDYSYTPNGHAVIRGADNISILPIAADLSSNVFACPPLFISDCNTVNLFNLYISSDLSWSVDANHHTWPLIYIQNCRNVYIEKCSTLYELSNPKAASGDVAVGAGMYFNNVARLHIKNSEFGNCRSGCVILNSNFTLSGTHPVSWGSNANKYDYVIGASIGTKSSAASGSFYTYYSSDNPNFTTGITFTGAYSG